MALKSTPADTVIELPPLDIRTIVIRLIGDSPLVSHRWADKAKKEMLSKQMKEAQQAKLAKDPWADYVESLYWLTPQPTTVTEDDIDAAKFGFPVVAFKAAAVDACSHVANITKVVARGAFHVIGEMVEICGTPKMREDMVRVGMGTADIRYRGEFTQWETRLVVRFNAAVISESQIVNLFNVAGFAIGVGEWRPQKDGSWGMFHVATEGE